MAPHGLHGTGTLRQVQLWYPAASASAGTPAPYVPDPTTLGALHAGQFMNLPDCVFAVWENMKLSARLNAPVARNLAKLPLIMIAPGAGLPRIVYSSYAQQFASDGYVVATIDFAEGGYLVVDGTAVGSAAATGGGSDYAAQAQDMAAHLSDVLDAFLRQQGSSPEGLDTEIAAEIDPQRILVVGHSLGGAAALDACADDPRIKACVDLDGVPESPIADRGIQTSGLMLRSNPDYSDADLTKLHRDRATWDAMGEKLKTETAKLLAGAGPDAWIITVHKTGHLSYTDAPFTMPTALTRYGGTYIDAQRMLTITTAIIEGYCKHVFEGTQFSIANFPEATVQTARRRGET
jgi:dienelactone hydrolase